MVGLLISAGGCSQKSADREDVVKSASTSSHKINNQAQQQKAAVPRSSPKQAAPANVEPPTVEQVRLFVSKRPQAAQLSKLLAASVAEPIRYLESEQREKCREVYFLDHGAAQGSQPNLLRQQGYAVRVRHNQAKGCQNKPHRGRGIAVVLNHYTPDMVQAAMKLGRFRAAQEHRAESRVRYQRRATRGTQPKQEYVVGGTVRGLKQAPQTVGDIAKLFPEIGLNVSDLPLRKVSSHVVTERKLDVGALVIEDQRLPVETFGWWIAGEHVLTEIRIEGSPENRGQIVAVVDKLSEQLKSTRLDIQSKEHYIYQR